MFRITGNCYLFYFVVNDIVGGVVVKGRTTVRNCQTNWLVGYSSRTTIVCTVCACVRGTPEAMHTHESMQIGLGSRNHL